MNDFQIMQKMSEENMDIIAAPPSNFKRANTGKDGFGEVVMAVGNSQIIDINKYLPILYLVNFEQYQVLKGE